MRETTRSPISLSFFSLGISLLHPFFLGRRPRRILALSKFNRYSDSDRHRVKRGKSRVYTHLSALYLVDSAVLIIDCVSNLI